MPKNNKDNMSCPASSMATMYLEESLKKGKTILIPSLEIKIDPEKNKKKPCTDAYCPYWSHGFTLNCSAPSRTISGISPKTCPRYTNK